MGRHLSLDAVLSLGIEAVHSVLELLGERELFEFAFFPARYGKTDVDCAAFR